MGGMVMKKRWITVLTIVGLIVLIINLLTVNQTWIRAESAWKQILQLKINHPAGAVGFINGTNGVTVGNFGECHYTTDGGET